VAEQELERAYRLKSQFLASMSHELRTPINALLGYTSLMRDHIYGELNQRQEEALARMYTASQHLLELVNDILDLAKIEAGKMPVHVEPVDVSTVIRELSQTIEPMVRARTSSTRWRSSPTCRAGDGPDQGQADRPEPALQRGEVHHEGHIAVRARARGGREGVDIDPSRHRDRDQGGRPGAKIFEDFRQVDQSSTREYGGTGLGLSITKKLLHLLGGCCRRSFAASPSAPRTTRGWPPSAPRGG
jgi:signal transduction histidine kinase